MTTADDPKQAAPLSALPDAQRDAIEAAAFLYRIPRNTPNTFNDIR